ncbi:MAG: M20/M25/M40 family metallo-hydrolase, partial [Gammaproteobacteria bacterium]
DLGPWLPKVEDGRLYGRGGADDGYAVYASLAAIMALREQNVPHARCFVLIEACEESGSYDLPFYMQALSDRIGEPDLVICLDSGCGNYEQLWCTTSLRGMAAGVLQVRVLDVGVHSGNAGGIVPCSFRVSRALIERVEEASTGVLKDDSFFAQIPEPRRDQATQAARVLGEGVYAQFPFAEATQPHDGTPEDLILNRTWRPALAVTGAEGMPPLESAGSVLRPYTALKLSMRLPPTCDSQAATLAMARLLESDPPHGASVSFKPDHAVDGWDAPPTEPWLEAATQKASAAFFGADCVHMGEGGSIPFMGMLGEQYPKAQFLVTGVLGPESNAHGPNEFLHLQTGKRVTACVASVLADQARVRAG